MAESERVTIEVEDVPIEERLRYDGAATNLHQTILSRLIARRKLSERAMSRRYDAWNRVDEHCRMFIDLTRKAKNADGSSGDKNEMPWARSIVVPMSYAILQVYLTQLIGIFTRRDPPLEIHGVGPEDVRGAKLMNAVMAWDQVQTNYTLELYTVLQDSMKYGMGGFHDCWEEEWGWKRQENNDDMMSKIIRMFTGRQQEPQKVWDKLISYNKVEAWDAFNFFPDPRVSLSNIQNGEFCGHRLWRGYLDILSNSIENGGPYFNVRQIPKGGGTRQQQLRSRNRFQTTQMNLVGSMDDRDRGFHAVDSFIVSIIPRDWQLGDGDRPEKWQFTWVDDMVIIRAHPSDYDHGRFNYSAAESNIDTHVFGNQGSIENMDGLQRYMNWIYNSHIQNVIRHLNNRMIYSKQFVESFDIENPEAAMHIRLTALGEQMLREGKMGINNMVQQLQLGDVTGGMIKDVSFLMDMAMRMSGAADQMMGRTTQERRTLGEVTRVGHEGGARMSMHAHMFDVQCLRTLALRWSANRQQYTDNDQFVRIGGTLAEEFGDAVINGRLKVRPRDLYGNYDYIPMTGNAPLDPAQRAAAILSGANIITGNPQIIGMPDRNGKVLDIHELLKEVWRDSGIKNPDDFYKAIGGQPGQNQVPGANVRVLPDDQVARMAERGDALPVSQAA